jgi:hypothetical protein
MSREINHAGTSDDRLPAGSADSRGCWTDIGEAQVTHTIFGRAKVRIIRRQDKVRRTLWLTATAAMALTVLAWQIWLPSQAEPPHSADPAAALDAGGMEAMSSPAEVGRPAIPQQPSGLASVALTPPKTVRPVPTSKPLPPVSATPSVAMPVPGRPVLVSPLAGEAAPNPPAAAADQAASPASPQP